MLCPKCNFEFNSAETDTCPACNHQPGKSMYLDAAVKIDDNSIIVDENITEYPGQPASQDDASAPGMPINAVYNKIVDEKTSGAGTRAQKTTEHTAHPRPTQQERRKVPRQIVEELPPENKPSAATGAKSLAISVSIGALLLISFIGAGIYYLKYNASINAPAQIASKPLMLPAPGAPPPTYKAPQEEKQHSSAEIATDKPQQTGQHDTQSEEPAPEKAPVTQPDTARQEIKTEPAREAVNVMNMQEHAAAPASPAKSVATPPDRESLPPGSYVLLCGSFKNRQIAHNTLEKLLLNHYPAFIEEADLGARGQWFRIKVGGFNSKDAAEIARVEIKRKLNIDAMASKKK